MPRKMEFHEPTQGMVVGRYRIMVMPGESE